MAATDGCRMKSWLYFAVSEKACNRSVIFSLKPMPSVFFKMSSTAFKSAFALCGKPGESSSSSALMLAAVYEISTRRMPSFWNSRRTFYIRMLGYQMAFVFMPTLFETDSDASKARNLL